MGKTDKSFSLFHEKIKNKRKYKTLFQKQQDLLIKRKAYGLLGVSGNEGRLESANRMRGRIIIWEVAKENE